MKVKYSFMFYKKAEKLINFVIEKKYHPIVIGKENIPATNFLLVGNHINLLDPALLIYGLDGREISFMAKKELFDNRLLGYLISKMGSFSIDRGHNDIKAVKKAISLLKDNRIVGIFPEGTRSNELLPFKKGACFVAKKGNVPMLPFGISGEYKKNGNLTLSIGNKIVYDDSLSVKENTDIVKEKVKELIR